jgi:hypothetical protein
MVDIDILFNYGIFTPECRRDMAALRAQIGRGPTSRVTVRETLVGDRNRR